MSAYSMVRYWAPSYVEKRLKTWEAHVSFNLVEIRHCGFVHRWIVLKFL